MTSYNPDYYQRHKAKINARARRYEKDREVTKGYGSWKAMRRRCNDPKHERYHDYGGRGIDYDPRWNDFKTFCADVGPRPSPKHTLDRIDPEVGYWPGNVRWATPLVQALNKRSKKIEVTRGDYGDPWSDTLADQCAA
jgi:hypothetical protein